MLRRILLVCGILSSLVYATMDVIGGLQWQNYSWLSQEFSRLSAVGAPSRAIHLLFNPIYSLLVVAFGMGIWMSAGPKRSLRVVSIALIAYAIVSWMWPQFFPEDLSQPMTALTNNVHIVLTFVTVISWILILGFSAVAFKGWFRFFSIGILLAVIVFGSLAGSQVPALAAGLPTPWLGLAERINIYSFMLWVVLLSIVLLRAPAEKLQGDTDDRSG